MLTCISDCSLLSVNVYLIQEPLNVVVQQLLMELKWYRMLGSAGMCMRSNTITHTPWHAHTTVFRPFFRDHAGEPLPEENFFWTFMVQGKITEADTSTIRLGATQSVRINQRPPSSSPHFYAICPFCHNRPTLSWLGTGTKYAGFAYTVAWFTVIPSISIH